MQCWSQQKQTFHFLVRKPPLSVVSSKKLVQKNGLLSCVNLCRGVAMSEKWQNSPRGIVIPLLPQEMWSHSCPRKYDPTPAPGNMIPLLPQEMWSHSCPRKCDPTPAPGNVIPLLPQEICLNIKIREIKLRKYTDHCAVTSSKFKKTLKGLDILNALMHIWTIMYVSEPVNPQSNFNLSHPIPPLPLNNTPFGNGYFVLSHWEPQCFHHLT